MEKIILSLKNLYKILLTNDFPIYSEGVIGEKNRKGQTVLRFWQQQIIPEFKSLPYGKMIWRNDGKRNRYTSHLCNRNTELKLYGEYAKELAAKTSVSSLLNQIERFMDFLSAREYRHDILLRRIREMVRLCQAEDPRLTREIAAQINDNCGECEWLSRYGVQGNLFQAGYLLTVMSLYAAAGEAMDDPVLAVLREDAYHMDALWEARAVQQERQRSATVFLTNHAGLLQDAPLPQNRFFGREEELYDLLEMVQAQRKCLISGIGGIGKTELLRQLIRQCSAEHTVDKLAIVPYENGIVESFARAFPNFLRQDPEENFHSILHQMAQAAEGGERLLLVIDDLTAGLREDPALAQLANLPCGVLITSRQSGLEGFEVYRMTAPAVSTGALIFRDNFGRPLTREDRELLKELLCSETLCHPLTLRMLARAAGSKLWSVTQLKEHLQEHNIALTWTEEDRTVRLSQMYHQLYSFSGIPDSCHSLVELFTVLPSGSYSKEFLEELMGGAALPEMDLLVRGGWLDESGSGWHMHPLIAQCLRRKAILPSWLESIIQPLRKALPPSAFDSNDASQSEPSLRSCEILAHLCGFLAGPVSRGLLLDVLTAMDHLLPTALTIDRYTRLLKQFLRRCPDCDGLVMMRYCTTVGHWMRGDRALFEPVFRAHQDQPDVPDKAFLDFCLYAAGSLIFRQEPALAEEMLQEVLRRNSSAAQKAIAYYHLAVYHGSVGHFEEALQWSQDGVAFVTEHPDCGETARFNNLVILCSFYLKFGQKALAEPLLSQIQAAVSDHSPFLKKLQYADLAGAYELNFGSLEKALEHYRQVLALRMEYYGKDQNYYVSLGQMAIVLQRLNRYSESIDCYHRIIAHARSVNDSYMLHMFSNNLAVAYLAMGRPEDAVPHVITALDFARQQGGIALGETLKNLARAQGMLGRHDEELLTLREACPLLEAAYGPEHPRCAPCLQRLKELQG